MRQTWPILLLLSAVLLGCGCNERSPSGVAGGIISLTPAGADLLVAMGLSDRVIGVSPYEANEALRRKLPKVGDYLRVDWERAATLRPAYMIFQGKRDRLPPGVREKCRDLGITSIILQIDRLADIDTAVLQIGGAIGQESAARKTVDDLARRRTALEQRRPTTPVQALVVFSDSGTQVVGRNNFIDDALALAGGANVVSGDGYLAIDREKLASLRPRVVFLVLANADAATIERGRTALAEAGLHVGATVVPITDVDALMPGTSAYRLAETMAARLKAPS